MKSAPLDAGDLRFSAGMLALRDFIRRDELDEIMDGEARLNAETSGDLFPFLLPEWRVEILVHTVHHPDLVRHFLGGPRRVHARTVKHPRFPKLASTRSSVILDYDGTIRCCLSINHCHRYGLRHMGASVRIEGTEDCAVRSFRNRTL
jgi:predicted dehydrogenase